MTLKDWADISVVAQGVLLPLSIFILIWQVQKQSKLTRAANAQSLVEIASPFNLALVQDAAMAELWRDGASKYSEMDPILQERYMNMLTWWILLHENIHNQWREGLIDEAIYNSWQRDLDYFIVKHRMADRWPSIRGFYHVAFVQHVDGLIKRKQQE